MHCRLWVSPSCFLLVTVLLSHRHLALAALLPTRSSSSSEDPPSSAAYSVAWSGPAPGDRFGSGDAIVGEWQVTPQNQKVVSPSFRLCVGGEDGCGATIWPEVVEKSEGSYYVSLTAPSVTTESAYYLQMKDDFGHTYSSPIFNIASTPQKKNKPAAHPPDVDQPRPDQAPMSSSPSSSSSSSAGTKSKGAADSDPDQNQNPAAAPADPNGTLSPPSAVSLSPNSAATSTPGNNGNGSGSGSGPQVAAAGHNAPPAAAIAVPLSLTGAIILLAGGLALHHRRQLAAEKERASWSSSSSSSWPWNKDARRCSPGLAAFDLGGGNSRSSRDVEKALFFARGGGGSGSALFRGDSALHGRDRDRTHDVVYHDHDGHFPEKAAVPFYSSYAPSSYACSAPEPRQRTRELDLPTREFTRPRPRTRTRAHPSPSSSPSSYYRGLWDRRYTLRRSTRSANDNNNTNTNTNTNGGGSGSSSLWRSLSFAAARHRVPVPPVAAPPSALNSPTMTVVTSVTSEVLPSYLPSPQFDVDGSLTADQAHAHGVEHGATTSVGDLGFENVPLSPPLPPPLHTRGEAADPEDSRMKELRGVYEAVARALGSTHDV